MFAWWQQTFSIWLVFDDNAEKRKKERKYVTKERSNKEFERNNMCWMKFYLILVSFIAYLQYYWHFHSKITAPKRKQKKMLNLIVYWFRMWFTNWIVGNHGPLDFWSNKEQKKGKTAEILLLRKKKFIDEFEHQRYTGSHG